MKKKKVYGFDLNGTLFSNFFWIINHKNIEEIKNLSKNSTLVFLSGMSWKGFSITLDNMDVSTGYFIGYNGSQIIDISKKKEVYYNFLNKNSFLNLLSIISDHILLIYWNSKNKNISFNNVKELSNFLSVNTKEKTICLSLVVKNINSLKNKLSKESEFRYIFWEKNFLTIMPKEDSKLNSLKLISKIEGFNVRDIFYFGDNENDLEVFKNVDNSISMLNSSKKIKKVTKFSTTLNNNQGGVGHFLSLLKK